MNSSPQIDAITAALDKESYEWLEMNREELLVAIETAVRSGIPPKRIWRHIIIQTQRPEISHRCHQAARHIKRGVDNGL